MIQAEALRTQVAALVSEAEHGEQVKRADPESEAKEPVPSFYNVGSPTDATAQPRRPRRSP